MAAGANDAGRPALGFILPASWLEQETGGNGHGPGHAPGSAADVAELCRRAEASGADSLWAVDHLFWPHPLDEAMVRLAVAAAATTRVTLGTCVLQLPLRHAPAVAKQATALQILSEGRFILGLGVGSHEGEYRQAGVDYHRRGHLMDAGIAELHRSWATGADGAEHYHQTPVAPSIPIWLGGSSAAARRRAAAVGDGWVPLFVTAEHYGPALESLRQETEAAGRPADAVEPAVVVFVRVGPNPEAHDQGCQWLSTTYGLPTKAFDRHLVAGPAEACARRLAEFARAGARHILVMVAATNPIDHFSAVRDNFMAGLETAEVGMPA
jgi:alkanesulfonate monooxygenase SsuD/methylene tetrahydromethanopterin reductase-like flavin-dependent oxidoreductase (luciferase family)